MTEPRFSVLVPAYNRERFVTLALESCLAQTYEPFEVIVVDDASTDGTVDAVDSLIRGLDNSGDDREARPNLRIIRLPRNQGVSAARNRAVEEAKGDFVVWLDSDDVLLPGALQAYADAMKHNSTADILYGHWMIIDAEGRHIGERRFKAYGQEELIPALVGGNVIPQGGACIRRTCFSEVGSFDPELLHAEDYDFYVRAAACCRFMIVNQIVYAYREHGLQLSGPRNAADKQHEKEVVRRIEKAYGFERMFPDLFRVDAAQAEVAARFRLAGIFHERNGSEERDQLTSEALACVKDSSEVRSNGDVHDEAAKLLYMVGRVDRKAYREHAKHLHQAWPESREMRKHHALSWLPQRVHGWLRR